MRSAGHELGQESGHDIVPAARKLVAPVPGVSAARGRPAVTGACAAGIARDGHARRLPAVQALALQRAVGNRALSRLIAAAPAQHAGRAAAPRRLQREVRIDGGRRRVNESKYKTGFWWWWPTNLVISGLIDDPVKRVFVSEAELEQYAAGQTDYIGDVHTRNGDTFWFRLPKDKLTVLGEEHENPDGNVEDVILGLGTKRFKYEPLNEIVGTTALNVPLTGTQSRLGKVNAGYRVSAQVDRAHFDPDLENIVIKGLTGCSMLRNEFIAASPADRNDPDWKKRPTKNDYSGGERVALYTSMAIHIAADLAAGSIAAPSATDTAFIKSARGLRDAYRRNQGVLDAFMTAKDNDDLIAVFELTSPGGFANLSALKDFTLAFHEYGSRYIEQLGTDSSDATLIGEGRKLAGNLSAGLSELSPAREAIMWQKIQAAAGFLIIGMGDAHRVSLKPKLDSAGIPHARVDKELRKQASDVAVAWVP